LKGQKKGKREKVFGKLDKRGLFGLKKRKTGLREEWIIGF
jgi:hypothetical protein